MPKQLEGKAQWLGEAAAVSGSHASGRIENPNRLTSADACAQSL